MTTKTKVEKYGSGTGNSYQSDWQKCQRFFFHKHRRGLTHREVERIVALAVGTAGHLWYEKFYGAILRGEGYEKCMGEAAQFFWEGSEEAARVVKDYISWETIAEDEKMNLALLILCARARTEFDKQESGQERTLGLEEADYLYLPYEFKIPASPETFTIAHTCGALWETEECENLDADCLRRFTIKIDRVMEDRDKGITTIDHKFTSMLSPKGYANEMLDNDQLTRYVHVRNTKRPDQLCYRGLFNVNRLHQKIGPASFHEEPRVIDENRMIDSWMRLCLERAEMSAKWDKPMELWEARKYSFGPCIKFGRECEFKVLCDDPGREHSHISEHGGGGKYWLPEEE